MWGVCKGSQHRPSRSRLHSGPLGVCTAKNLHLFSVRVLGISSMRDTQLARSRDREVGPEAGEQCHLLHEKTNSWCLFPLRACRVYYGALAGLEPQPRQLSGSHRSRQRLPVHPEWIKPGASQECHGKTPKSCRLSTSAKVQDTPLKQERLLEHPPVSPSRRDTSRTILLILGSCQDIFHR